MRPTLLDGLIFRRVPGTKTFVAKYVDAHGYEGKLRVESDRPGDEFSIPDDVKRYFLEESKPLPWCGCEICNHKRNPCMSKIH